MRSVPRHVETNHDSRSPIDQNAVARMSDGMRRTDLRSDARWLPARYFGPSPVKSQ